ncbi:hypothetical protein [Azohydromonas lata]|uniref:hypothetical protein n=1 Tax=Azohydromonas lata TaxID=45677 RepID=UPI0008323A81|nr:hypothetical protein [Azohydromonas lata]
MGITTAVLYRLRWLATAMIGLCLGQITVWGLDREPPFKLQGYAVERPVHPGGPLRITLSVARDLRQSCDVQITRYIVDGGGFRFYMPQIGLDAHAIAELQSSSRDENRILIQMPEDAAPGDARFGNALSYVCNPIHRLWPVRVAFEVPFDLTPIPVAQEL